MKCPDCGHQNILGADTCDACSASLTNAPESPKRGMEKRILEGKLSDLSPKKATQVKPSDSILKAVEAMRKEKIGCVLAVEEDECVGMLSERELILMVPETQDLAKSSVRSAMFTYPTCLRHDDDLAVTFHQMTLSGHLHMPVRLKDGSFGVVSARDLLRYLCK